MDTTTVWIIILVIALVVIIILMLLAGRNTNTVYVPYNNVRVAQVGAPCTSNAQCGSGEVCGYPAGTTGTSTAQVCCASGDSIVRNGVTYCGLPPGSNCSANDQCSTNACAYFQAGAQQTTCCNSSVTDRIVGLGTFCTNLSPGELCWSNSMCAAESSCVGVNIIEERPGYCQTSA